MMYLIVLALLFVTSTSANVIREEQNICFNIAGVNLCGDPSIRGKRDEQNICFHVGGVEICGDPSISGKRDEQNICFHLGGVEICGDPSIRGKRVKIGNCEWIGLDFFCNPIITGKREQQSICFHVGGVEICGDPSISGKRDEKDKRILPCYYIDGVRTCIPGIKREEDLNLAEIVTNIGNVIHVIDQFVGGAATKREEQDSVGCIIAGCMKYCNSSGEFTNICKREEQNISIPFCYILDGVRTCIPNIKREEESLNLADIVANIGKVIHVIDGFVSGATA